MNLYRFIKVIYGILVSTFAFIISSILLNAIGGVEPKFIVYVITILFMFLFYYMNNKISKKNGYKIIIVVHNVLYFITLCIMFGVGDNLSLQLIVLIQEVLLFGGESGSITRDFYKSRLRNLVIFLVVGIVFSFFASKEVTTYLYPFYMLFLITGIILLRASRAFQYKLESSKKAKSYIIIIVLSLFLFNPYIYTFLLNIIKILYKKIEWIPLTLIYFISLLLEYPIKMIQALLANAKTTESVDNGAKTVDNQLKVGDYSGVTTNLVLKIIFILLIVMFFIIMFRMILKRSKDKQRNIETLGGIERESLEELGKNNKKIKKNNWSGANGKILEIFYNIEKDTYKKNIFKRSMTASQLFNISKSYIDRDKEFKNIIDTYNEAKFSSHEISKEVIKEYEENYKGLKKQIKDIKKA
ncbi:hypothetical protein [Clostridium manihotivorum]|uniref:DUF4129 domain-containing protein n=1 Tax=Clostridium manihotivorum TaxID=2320868 RepID=A0A3R5UBQ0_9CLOT|nr:hypothetical protein [Clostridium manihotivorum]QAA35009.1 hypothetical protein C1I91_27050 [Clostridium manihotivorum]